jgi:hypothetical protein
MVCTSVCGPKPPQYAVIVQNGRGQQIAVPLEKDKTTFGRYPQPRNDVCLADPEVGHLTELARYHFAIRWEAAATAHVVVDYGQRYPIASTGFHSATQSEG